LWNSQMESEMLQMRWLVESRTGSVIKSESTLFSVGS
jgi:hypothetical protein